MNFLELANSLNTIANMRTSNFSKSVPEIIQEIENRLQEAQTMVARFKVGEINAKTVDIFVDNFENVLDAAEELADELENRYPDDGVSSESEPEQEDIPDDFSIKSDETFNEEERSYIENERHYAFLKKFGLRPTKRRNFAECYKSEDGGDM
jgi:hypothetical protein